MGDDEYYDVEVSIGGLTKAEVHTFLNGVLTNPSLLRNLRVNRVKAFEETGTYR